MSILLAGDEGEGGSDGLLAGEDGDGIGVGLDVVVVLVSKDLDGNLGSSDAVGPQPGSGSGRGHLADLAQALRGGREGGDPRFLDPAVHACLKSWIRQSLSGALTPACLLTTLWVRKSAWRQVAVPRRAQTADLVSTLKVEAAKFLRAEMVTESQVWAPRLADCEQH